MGEITVWHDIREEFGVTAQSDRLAADYRARVIGTGLIVSWLALAVFVIWVFSLDDAERTSGLVVAGGLLAALVALPALLSVAAVPIPDTAASKKWHSSTF